MKELVRQFDYTLSPSDVRRVWAAVTREPGVSLPVLAERLNLGRSMTYACLRWLQDAGYIVGRGRRAREIVVPCVDGARIVPPAHPGVSTTEAR